MPPKHDVSIDSLRLESDRRLVSVLLVLSLIPILWFVGVDVVVYANDPQRLRARLLVRAVSVVVPIVGFFMLRRAATVAAYSKAVFFVVAAICAILLGLNLQRPFGSGLPLRTPLMALIVLYGALPNTFYLQVVVPIAFSVGIVLERTYWLTDNSSGDLPSDIAILVFVNLAGIAMVFRRILLERQVSDSWKREHSARAVAEAALQELKTLRGIIRICTYCRKVHNETGAWQQIETYVRDHSHVEFSHGICPTCMAEYYPPNQVME